MRGEAEELFSLLRAGYFTRLIEFAEVDGKKPRNWPGVAMNDPCRA